MIFTVCDTCLQPYRLSIGDRESVLLEQIKESGVVPCPRLCGGYLALDQTKMLGKAAAQKSLKDPLHLTVTELFQALHGHGLPDEIPKDELVVKALLEGSTPLNWVFERDGKNIYLHEIVLKDVVVHLASGMRGAQILKITKKVPHVGNGCSGGSHGAIGTQTGSGTGVLEQGAMASNGGPRSSVPGV